MARCFSDGPTLKHYTYDGLGRLIRTQSPFPTPQHAALGEVRSERFYYDGIRRIQETRLDPSKNLGGAMLAGDPQVESAALASLQEAKAGTGDPAAAEIDLTAAPLTLENQLLAMADPGPGPGPGPDQPASPVQLVREYVWGPGDAWHPATVDELLCYYGEGREAYWPIQDSSGDVAAVCVPGLQADGYAARVAAQQRYDAYGQVLSADHLLPHAFLAAGHKGLFYDRLDRGVSDSAARGSAIPPSSATTDTPRLVPFARGLYHVRNRTMLPGGGGHTAIVLGSLTCANPPTCSTWTLSQQGLSSGAAVQGRFMQADPNATGMVLIKSKAYHATVIAMHSDHFELQGRFRDGANIYEYGGGNALARSDALGLSYATEVGSLLGEMAYALVNQYSANLQLDLEWAGNWNQADDAHTRLSSSWVFATFADVMYQRGRDAMLGPIGDVLELIDLGAEIYEYFFAEEGSDLGEGEYVNNDGPTMAGAEWRSPMRSLMKHGGKPHRVRIARLITKGRAYGGSWFSARVNRQLIDPKTGETISKLRPDYFNYDKITNTVIIGEAIASQPRGEAMAKLKRMRGMYRRRGYNVRTFLEE